MNILLKEAFEELDIIVKAEYGRTYALSLLEAKDEDDSALTTPISRAASFPARAIRFRKAKSVMNKYARKIISKYDKIIDKFENGIDKSLPIIVAKGKELQDRLEAAKTTGDKVEQKSIVNQQQKYNDEVEKDLQNRILHLNNAIDNLVDVYTSAIHKRIEEPGYVLTVELSPKGQAELKFIWAEKVAGIKQLGYEKLVRVLNNKNVKQLESLVAKLQVEIDDAKDERTRNLRSSRSLLSPEEKLLKGDNKDAGSQKLDSDYKKLKKYLNDSLPFELSEKEPYEFESDDFKMIIVYLDANDKEEKITASFYNDENDFDEDNPIKEKDIETREDADVILGGIKIGEETKQGWEKEDKKPVYVKRLYSNFESLFNVRPEYIKKMVTPMFYMDYKDKNKLKKFAYYIVLEVLDDPKKYSDQYKHLQKTSIPDKSLILSFMKEFRDGFEDFEKKNESFMSLHDYKKLNS